MPGPASDESPLAHDVVAVDGVVLARAGEPLTPALLEELERKRLRARLPLVALAETEVLSDLVAAVREPLYAVVFAGGEARRWMEPIEGLRVPAPIVEELRRLRDLGDGYTYRHLLITTALTARMLQDLGLGPHEVRDGAFSALTHDVGKLRVAQTILLRDAPLVREEARALREHPRVGALLLRYYLGAAVPNVRVALEHHERPDGSGYPARLRLEDRLVRVVSVNDIFDALVSPRPYRNRAFDVRGALELLWMESRAGRADERACRLLISYSRRDTPDPWRLTVSEEARSWLPETNTYGGIQDE